MTVTRVAAGHQDPIRPSLKSPQYQHRIHPSGAGYPDDSQVGGLLQPADPGQVSPGITAPVTAKSDYFRLPLAISRFSCIAVLHLRCITVFRCIYRHAASTSAINCSLENPFRFRAPDRHSDTHAPHPWHKPLFTSATTRDIS